MLYADVRKCYGYCLLTEKNNDNYKFDIELA